MDESAGALSHGLVRVPGYVASLRSGKVNGRSDPIVATLLPAVVHVDGDKGVTPLAIERGMPARASAAKASGIAVLAITRAHAISAGFQA